MRECYILIDEELIEAEFVGIYQYSKVVDTGGVVAFPVAIVKVDNKFRQVDPSKVVMVEE